MSKMTEIEWLEANSAKFGDDQQKMYFAQLKAIMRGELDMVLNDNHEQSWQYEKAELAAFFDRVKNNSEELF
jgi:hypothetical protein